jgi:hypothetical protein
MAADRGIFFAQLLAEQGNGDACLRRLAKWPGVDPIRFESGRQHK